MPIFFIPMLPALVAAMMSSLTRLDRSGVPLNSWRMLVKLARVASGVGEQYRYEKKHSWSVRGVLVNDNEGLDEQNIKLPETPASLVRSGGAGRHRAFRHDG